MQEKGGKASDFRNILVAVAGQTPAIITETLWALEQLRGIRIDEIRVITTTLGYRCIVDKLLGEGGGFTSYCADYRVPHGRIAFSDQNIYVLADKEGQPLADIRTTEDNSAAADHVFSLVQEWTQRKSEALFCSAAGGRKTLGIYLAASLMLCGRPSDSLSHVLVSQEFETGVPDFFYPMPEERIYEKFAGIGEAGKPFYKTVSSLDARVELANIPFIKLRELIGGGLPIEKGFNDAVVHSQLLLEYLQVTPPLILHLDTGSAAIGNFSFRMPRQLRAVYAFFVQECNGKNRSTTIEELYEKRHLLADYERQIDRLKLGEKETYSWEKVRDVFEFRSHLGPCISKINKLIEKNLGRNRFSGTYKISTGGRYGVNIQHFKIIETERR